MNTAPTCRAWRLPATDDRRPEFQRLAWPDVAKRPLLLDSTRLGCVGVRGHAATWAVAHYNQLGTRGRPCNTYGCIFRMPRQASIAHIHLRNFDSV
jgi:hypothetical protein